MSDGPESCGMCWRGPGSNSACAEHQGDYVRLLEADLDRLNARSTDGELALDFLARMLSSSNKTYVDLGEENVQSATKVCIDGWVNVTPGEIALLRRLREQNVIDGT